MDAAEGDDVRAQADRLLERRQNPLWVSLSWVALRPLISSLNQVLCTASPSLIPQLRRFWLTQVEPSGTALARSRHLDRSHDTAFVVIGDTGEQDRSQYIVAPVLRRVVAGADGRADAARPPGFAVICSDVIYPSGDVNDYVHGLYLPYGPAPEAPAVPTALDQLPLYAIPGNHDWHDGLAGFMQQFCGTGPLPREQVGWPDEVTGTIARWQDGLVRLLWRRPVAARPQRMWRRLPGETSPELGDGRSAWSRRDVEQLRRLRRLAGSATRPDGKLPGQPGPYLSIAVHGLLVVAVDVGIGLGGGDSAIDADQGRWLLEVSRQPGPKVLLTGNPLLVNAQWKVCWIGGPPGEGNAPVDGYATVNEIVADRRFGYVATIGGDIHNFQHYPQTVGEPGREHLVHYLVSGGGGAYMSATHPVEVVLERATATAEASPDQDPAAVRAANRRTGGAAVGATDGSPGARLIEGPFRLIPTPPESLAHYARIVLPKVWRLERAVLASIAGIGVGQVLAVFDRGHTGRDLTIGTALLSALLVVRALVSKPLTRRLFRSRDVEHDPLNRAYRAAVTLTAALLGADLALSGAWTAGPSWTRHLVGWGALTTAAGVIAAVLRYTGWWREAVPRDSATAHRRHWVAASVWIVCILVAAGLGLLLPTWPRRLVPPGIVILVGLLGLLAVWLWRPAVPTVGHIWGRLAPLVSYLVQAAAMLAILTWAVFGRFWWLPSATALGVVSLGWVLLLSFAVAALVVRALGSVVSSRWQLGWGRVGGATPWLTGAVAIALLSAQLALVLRPGLPTAAVQLALTVSWEVPLLLVAVVGAVLAVRGVSRTATAWLAAGAALVAGLAGGTMWRLGDGALDAYRRTLSTELALGALLAVLLLIDTLRRRTEGLVFTALAIGVAALPVAVTWVLDLRTAWTLRAALVPVIGALLLLVTVVVEHLLFLGAQHLVVDRDAHGDRPDLLTQDQAAAFLAWRSREDGPLPLDRRRLRRARIVFPTTDSPQGPLQKKVSEIFDSDAPPFWKNFVVLRTRPVPTGTGTGSRLTIDVHVIHGTGTLDEEAVPVPPSIVIDLPG